MSKLKLEELYRRANRVVVTAHRGDSLKRPENTIEAFQSAIEKQSDLIEFDVRGSLDNVPVILHDQSVDRTSNGCGAVGSLSLKDLKRLDFSKAMGKKPTRIPTLQEVLLSVPENIGLNIQVKETERMLLRRICALIEEHDLYQRAYLTVSRFCDAEMIRRMDSRIDLCVLERRQKLDINLLKEMRSFGCRFLQPHRRDLTPELCGSINRMDFFANLFYSNTVEDHRRFIAWGVKGILTDDPALLVDTLREMKLFG